MAMKRRAKEKGVKKSLKLKDRKKNFVLKLIEGSWPPDDFTIT
jgi:hypothetical protein